MNSENSFEMRNFDLEETKSSSVDSIVEELEKSKSRSVRKYRSARSIEENIEKLKKIRNPENKSSRETSHKNKLQNRLEEEETGNTKMARRVLESEWILENREQAVQKEELYSEDGLKGSLAKVAVYEENGELKKDDELIQNALYSDKLEAEVEELLEKEVSGRESLRNWIDDARSMVENYEATAAESIYEEEENLVSDRELLEQKSEAANLKYIGSTAVAD